MSSVAKAGSKIILYLFYLKKENLGPFQAEVFLASIFSAGAEWLQKSRWLSEDLIPPTGDRSEVESSVRSLSSRG
jgi:hypothetical protein